MCVDSSLVDSLSAITIKELHFSSGNLVADSAATHVATKRGCKGPDRLHNAFPAFLTRMWSSITVRGPGEAAAPTASSFLSTTPTSVYGPWGWEDSSTSSSSAYLSSNHLTCPKFVAVGKLTLSCGRLKNTNTPPDSGGTDSACTWSATTRTPKTLGESNARVGFVMPSTMNGLSAAEGG